MSKWISADELIEFCDAERSMLNAHNGGNSVACAALRRVVDFVKEYAVETEPNKDWVSVKDRMPNEDEAAMVYNAKLDSMYVDYPLYLGEPKLHFDAGVTHWMPLPEKPESEGDAK